MEDNQLKRSIASRGYAKDNYTAREYQLERDQTLEPELDGFLKYLEHRALAMENAEQGHVNYNNKTVLHNVNAAAPCCYCAVTEPTDGVPETRLCSIDWAGTECGQ